MGLDIYLRKCPDLAAAKAAEKARDDETEALWDAVGGWDKATEEQKDEIRAKSDEISKRHGCTGRYEHHESIVELGEQNSTIDPDHMFKIGYFRSSYNGGGFESVMRKLGLPTLHDIFEPSDEYEVKPDWDAALTRCNDALARYEAHLASPAGKYSVMEVRPMFEFGVNSEKEALDMFTKSVLERESSPFGGGGWSNRDGEFYPEGMKVCAFITKTFKRSNGADPLASIFNSPSIFAVYEREDDGKENWYLTALKIVRESIEFVLAQPDKQHFYLTWSG